MRNADCSLPVKLTEMFSPSAPARHEHSHLVKNEITSFNLIRGKLAPTAGFKFKFHSVREADAVKTIEVNELRNQIDALPFALKESLRVNYFLSQDAKRRDMQEFQLTILGKLERILSKNMCNAGVNLRKFEIGGFERGTYGKT